MAFTNIFPDGFPVIYDNEWRLQVQQLTSRAEQYVNVDMVNGKSRRYHKMAKANVRDITTRFGETNPDDTNIEYRHVFVAFKDSAQIVDRREAMQLGQIGSPHSSILRGQAAAAGRDRDQTLINGLLGNAYEGENGTSTVALPVAQQIAVNYVSSGSVANSGLTFDKLLEVVTRFGTANVTGQDVEDQAPVTLLITHRQVADLLREPKFTSQDYQAIRALSTGKVVTLMGINIVALSPELFPYNSSTDVRTVVAFARSGVAFGIAENPMTFVNELPTHRHDVQLRTEWGWGCARINDEAVIQILCDESP